MCSYSCGFILFATNSNVFSFSMKRFTVFYRSFFGSYVAQYSKYVCALTVWTWVDNTSFYELCQWQMAKTKTKTKSWNTKNKTPLNLIEIRIFPDKCLFCCRIFRRKMSFDKNATQIHTKKMKMFQTSIHLATFCMLNLWTVTRESFHSIHVATIQPTSINKKPFRDTVTI